MSDLTVQLGALGKFIRGKGIAKSDLVKDGGLPCIRYAEIYTEYGEVIRNPISRVSKDAAANALMLEYGDIIFPSSGETAEEIGKASAFVGLEETYVGGDTIILRSHGQDPIYLSHALNSWDLKRQKFRLATGNSVVHIYAQELSQLSAWLPELAEQQKIVEILSDCDTAIEQTKTQIFRLGKEFEGFCNHLWQIGRHKKNLMQIGSFHAGLNGKTATDFGQGKRFITYMGVFNGPYIKDDAYGFVDVSPEENQHRIVNGDLLITMTSETKPETGYTAIFRSANADEDVYLNSFCVCYRSFDKEEHPPEVIHALMKSKHFRSKIWRISQGSTRINLSRSELGKLDLELPLHTQNEAAKRAVQDYAHHSEGLTKLLQKQNQQKHGLMQQLLTGKLRLKGAA